MFAGPVTAAKTDAPVRATAAAASERADAQRAGKEHEPETADRTGKAARPGFSWDFGNIPLEPPDRPAAARELRAKPLPPAGAVQRKLVVGRSDDPLEHEADRVADQVMRMRGPAPAVTTAPPRISRKCAACEEEEARALQRKPADEASEREPARATTAESLRISRKCAACEAEEERVQAKPADARGIGGHPAPAIVHDVVRAPGRPLDASTRRFFEPRFGHDLSTVRIHTDAEADASAQAVNATAYALGHHLVFRQGAYAPGTATGDRLIAHELTHVLQQSPAIRRDTLPKADPHVDPNDPYCHHGYGRGVNVKGSKNIVYAIMMNGMNDDSFEKMQSREVPLWIDWRYGAIPAEDKAKILAEYHKTSTILDPDAGQIKKKGCQYALGISLEAYARFNRIGDKARKPPQDKEGEGGKEGDGGTGEGHAGIMTGKKPQPSTAPVPEENPTIGIGNAAKESEKIKHDPTAKVKVDLSVFKDDPKLSQHLLDALEHFAGRKNSAEDTSAAAKGFSEDVLENQIIGKNASYRMLAYVYTQGWNEYEAAGGAKNYDAFFILEEALLEQLARGNPTAATNKLEIGHGNRHGEDKIIGIRHRDRGWLLYDETCTPYPGISGMGYLDPGYVGSRVKPGEGILNSFQLNIAKIEDPGLRAMLNSLRMNIGDPTRVTIQAAEFIFDNIDYLKDDIIKQVPAKIRDGLKDALKYFVGFMAGEAASSFMMKSPNPTMVGIGIALKALLTAAEYVMDVEMYGDIIDALYEAGRHLTKVEKKDDGTFTKLSARHLKDAEAPIVSLFTQLGMLGAMKAGGEIIGIVARLRAGGKAEIHCTFCVISDGTASSGDAPPAEAKGEGKGEPGKAEAKDEPSKGKDEPPKAKDEPPKGKDEPPKGKDEPPKADTPKVDDPNAPPKEGQQAKPQEPGAEKPGEKGDKGEQGEKGEKAETPEAKRDAAKRRMDAAQARFGRFKSLLEQLAAARKKLADAKGQQAVHKGKNIESNAAVRDAQAQILDLTATIKKEFDVDAGDSRAVEAKNQELVGDFKQAKDDFTPLDIQLDPKKYRAKLPCFVGGTAVTTPHGPRAIEALTAGDEVIAFDFQSGRFEPATVFGVHEASTDRLVHIRVAGHEIVATGRHPFWVEDIEGWVEAKALRAGMRLKTVGGGDGTISRVGISHRPDTPTFNLQVERLSSFCVGPGVLVHNEGVDAGQGGSYIIYRLTNTEARFANKVYVGQTTTSGKGGKARGAKVREGEHIQEAEAEIEAIKAELGGKPASPEVQERLDFFEFKKGATIEVLVYGIGNQAQADWLEQQNIDIERQLRGDSNVVNRREQISKERRQEVKEEIMKDPKVKCE